ncbi:tRNA epoxyqueuosine(34) reductase QueG [Clostridium sp. DL1XJH146]
MKLKEKIIDYCKNVGLDTIGFTKCRVFDELEDYYREKEDKGYLNEFEEKDIDKKINPFLQMKEGKTIISIAFPYYFGDYKKSELYFSKYTMGKDYHIVLGEYLQSVCEFIISLGGKAMYFVDSNPLPERYIAQQSGIGFIGKNSMLITEKYGSYVFLGEIITDLEIEEDKKVDSKCGECQKCILACPTKAINKNVNNPNICLSYMTQKKEIEEDWFEKLQGRIFGCDTCQDVCPYNTKIQFSKLNNLKPLDYMSRVRSEEILNMNNKEFKEKYKITSCGWRGKNILIRNVLISEITNNSKVKMDLKFNSPYLEKYYIRLLKKRDL